MCKEILHIQTSAFVQELGGVIQYSRTLNGVFEYVSPSITSVLGYSREEFSCQYTTYLVDSPVNDHVEKFTQLCCQGIQQEPYEICIYHKNGSEKWLLVSEVPDINPQGEVIGVHGIALDISPQKLLQTELLNDLHKENSSHQATHEINRQSLKQMARVRRLWNDTQRSFEKEKKRYHSIISNSFDAILILDASGKIKEVNPAAIEIFGWLSKEFLQKKIQDIIPAFHCSVACGECFNHLHEAIGMHKNKHKVSATLANSVHRVTDCVCRYGGEEFIAILPETFDSGAMHVAELFRTEVESLQIKHCASAVSDYVTISLGVAVCVPHDGIGQDGLIKAADKSLYKAKESRNNVVLAACHESVRR